MKYARRIWAGFCILIAGFSFLFLSGCMRWNWDKGYHHDYDEQRDGGGNRYNEENQGQHHEENRDGHHEENHGERY